MAGNSPQSRFRSVHAYAEAVRQWMSWQQTHYLFHSMPALLLPPPVPYTLPTDQPGQILPNGDLFIPATDRQVPAQHPPTPIVQPAPGREYLIPSIWKRAVAELVDFMILLVIKVIISMLVLKNFGLLHEETMDVNFLYEVMQSDHSKIDYDKLFSMTSEMLTIQMIHRICITVTESLWLCRGLYSSVGGSTPGKMLMHLRVIGCDDVTTIEPGRVRVINPRNLGLSGAFMRSLMKNFGISFFFPVVLTMFMFEHNRAIYDVGVSSIVVSEQVINPNAARVNPAVQ